MFNKIMISVAIIASGFSATTALAGNYPDFGISMMDVQTVGPYPVLKVTANGQGYHEASTAKLTFRSQAKGRCQKLHWLDRISLNLQDKGSTQGNTGYHQIKILTKAINQKTWSNDWLNYVRQWSPNSKVRNAAVAQCNAELDKRVQQGGDRSTILQAGFQTVLKNKVYDQLNFACNGPSPNNVHPRHEHSMHPITLDCASYTPPASQTPGGKAGIDPVFKLKSPLISMTTTNYKGSCPANLPVKAVLRANHIGGSFQFRFLEENSPVSGWKNISFAPGTTSKNVAHSIKVQAPIQAAPKAKGFQAPKQGNAQLNPILQKAPTRKVSIQVRKDNLQMSDFEEYSVTCSKPKIAKFAGKTGASGKPDLTSRKGMTIGAKSAPWGGTIMLAKKDAISSGPRGCRFRFLYDVVNLGKADSGGASNRLRRGNGVLHTVGGFAVNMNQTRNVSGHITLGAGNYYINASIDDKKEVTELKETNNRFKLRVKVNKNCGGGSGGSTRPKRHSAS